MKENHSTCEDIVSPDTSVLLSENMDNSESCKLSSPVDVNSFIVEFIQKNYGRIWLFLENVCGMNSFPHKRLKLHSIL